MLQENPAYSKIEIDRIVEDENPDIVEKYDYYYVPCMFIGDAKVYEANPAQGYEEIKASVKNVFDMAIGESKNEDSGFIKGDDSFIKYDEEGKVIAEVTFPETEPGVYTIDHTFVDGSLRGQGMASKLVQMAVDEIQNRGGEVRATCSYAKKWLEEKEQN